MSHQIIEHRGGLCACCVGKGMEVSTGLSSNHPKPLGQRRIAEGGGFGSHFI